MHKFNTSPVVVVVAALCLSVWCQTPARKSEAVSYKSVCLVGISETDKAKWEATSNTARSGKSGQRFAEDFDVLRSAQTKLRSRFPEGFSNSDIKQVECQAWVDYREQNPNGHLHLDDFAKYAAENYGGLRVRSRPDGAAILVDNVPWDGPTNAQNMCSVGTRHVRLSKPGYNDELGDADVKQGQWTIFERDLREKKP